MSKEKMAEEERSRRKGKCWDGEEEVLSEGFKRRKKCIKRFKADEKCKNIEGGR